MSQPAIIDYTNHKGERRERKIIPTGTLVCESNEFHKELGWLLVAWDCEKKEYRKFAMKDIHSWRPA